MALRTLSAKNTGAESVQLPVQNAFANANAPLQMPITASHANAHNDLSAVNTDDLICELVKRFHVTEFANHFPSTAPGKNMTIRLNPRIRHCIDDICRRKGATITAVVERSIILLNAIMSSRL